MGIALRRGVRRRRRRRAARARDADDAVPACATDRTCDGKAILDAAARARRRRRSTPATASCPRTPRFAERRDRRRPGLGRAAARRDRARWATRSRPRRSPRRPACRRCPARPMPTTPATRSATRCSSRRPPAAAARACGSSRAPGELAEAVAAARARPPAAFGDDRVFLERYVARAPPRRDPDPRRHARQRRAPRRARVLDPAPPPEDHRGVALARASTPRCASRMGEAALRLARALGYAVGRHGRVPRRRRDRRVLLPRGEHPAAGRAPGDRGGDRASTSCASSSRIAAGEPLGYAQHDVAFDGRTPSRPGSTPRIPPPASCPRPARSPRSSPRRRRPCAGTPASTTGSRDRRRVRPDARQGDRPRADARARPRAGSRSRSSACTSAASRPTATSSSRVLRTPAFLAGDTTTDFIERVAPPRALELTGDELERIAAAARRSGSQGREPAPTRACSRRSRAAGATRGCPLSAIAFAPRRHRDRPSRYRSLRDGRFAVRRRPATRASTHGARTRSTPRSTGGAARARITRHGDRAATCGGPRGDVDARDRAPLRRPGAARPRPAGSLARRCRAR